MRPNHKCHFHPQYSISKFCQAKQCTLPICVECQPIHHEEHHQNMTQPDLITFQEAYAKANNHIETFLQSQKRLLATQQNRISSDKAAMMRLIEQYYGAAEKIIGEVRQQVEEVQGKLQKLKRGSIKTLIFYYSDEIPLNAPQMQFDTLTDRVRKMLAEPKPKQMSHSSIEAEFVVRKQDKYQGSKEGEQKEQQSSIPEPSVVQQIEENLKRLRERPRQRPGEANSIQEKNVFSSIDDDIKASRRDKGRRSIFQQYKRNSSHTDLEIKKEPKLKYNYECNLQVEPNQEGKEITVTALSPKFNYENHFIEPVRASEGKLRKTGEQGGRSTSKAEDLNAFMSFDKRGSFNYMAMIDDGPVPATTFADQAKKVKKEVHFDLEPREEEKENYKAKLLTPSDLDNEQQGSKLLSNQRSKSYSQVQLRPKSDYGIDLKKQVLAPEEIRKMLQKRMEERNRVLERKKGDNAQFQQERQVTRKLWETKDSFINHIYNDLHQ